MWVPTPSAPVTGCDNCKRGADQGVGPFWQGPKWPTGEPGFGGKQYGRLHICRECMCVIVNHPESPFHGLIPAAEAAADVAKAADEHVARLNERIAELSEPPEIEPLTLDVITEALDRVMPRYVEGLRDFMESVRGELLAAAPAVEVVTPEPPAEAKPAAKKAPAKKAD